MMFRNLMILLIACLRLTSCTKNLILILVDDLDLTLDGMKPLKNINELIGKEGITFENAYVASPICCPNRATILTGRYMHNHFVYNNTIQGNCSSPEWQQNFEKKTFANILKSKSKTFYKTFYAGKYMNKYGSAEAGGARHIPPGWDWWYGLVGNSKYYDYSLSINGTEKRYGSKYEDYLTDVITKFATDFLQKQTTDDRFLMVLAPPAPHSPFIPATRHFDIFKNVTTKKTKNFNNLENKTTKHWLVRMEPTPLPPKVLDLLDFVYRRRWETLLAVDDMVLKIHKILEERNILQNTYIIFTSDNGYHIGQFGLTIDKRQPYETDIKVPFLMKGPGIQPSIEVKAVGSIDIFATIMDIAGINYESDGLSILKSLSPDRSFLIEYKGEGSRGDPVDKCILDNDPNLSLCSFKFACKCQDSVNNTYQCVRRVSNSYNNLFCMFQDNENFMEMYDLNKDPFQLNNTIYFMKKSAVKQFSKRVTYLSTCSVETCQNYDMKRKRIKT